jgi:hypothetical protein
VSATLLLRGGRGCVRVCAARAAAPGEAPVSAQSSGGALRRRARKLSVSDCMRARTAAGRLSPRRVPGIQARGDALRVPSAARAFPEPLHAMGSLARWLAAGCCAYGMRLALAACPRLSSAQKSTYESSWTKSMCRVVCARALACVRVPPAELGGDAVCVCARVRTTVARDPSSAACGTAQRVAIHSRPASQAGSISIMIPKCCCCCLPRLHACLFIATTCRVCCALCTCSASTVHRSRESLQWRAVRACV